MLLLHKRPYAQARQGHYIPILKLQCVSAYPLLSSKVTPLLNNKMQSHLNVLLFPVTFAHYRIRESTLSGFKTINCFFNTSISFGNFFSLFILVYINRIACVNILYYLSGINKMTCQVSSLFLSFFPLFQIQIKNAFPRFLQKRRSVNYQQLIIGVIWLGLAWLGLQEIYH